VHKLFLFLKLTSDLEIQQGSRSCRGARALNFRTTLEFDREYLSNGSSNRQTENGVINYDFSHVWRKKLTLN